MSNKWVVVVWGILGFLLFLTGFSSQNVVTMVVGVAMMLGNVSAYLTSHVESDSTIKRAIEVAFLVAALAVFGYGYIITQSIVLGLMTAAIVVLTLVAFTLSYVLPKIRDKPKSTD